MRAVEPCAVPSGSLLDKYAAGDRNYTDCYYVEVAAVITIADFVQAFYSTWLFKQERIVLALLLSRPSTDDDARRLAAGDSNTFAAWHVEGRGERQLLMCDYRARTRSWFMVEPLNAAGERATRLYFGSAVVAVTNHGTGEAQLEPAINLLLGMHKMYSHALLRTAAARVMSMHARAGTDNR